MSKRKLEATRANQARKAGENRRLPPGAKVPQKRGFSMPMWGWATLGALAVAVVVVIGYLALGRSSSSPKAINWDSLPGLQTGPAPWTPGLDQLGPRLDAIGLQQLPQEALAQHIHQHLDVYIDGKKQPVPADIGIDQVEGFITELHVHQGEPGTIHVESPDQRTFTLGEFFAVWGVKLTQNCVGMYCDTGNTRLRAYVNGKPFDGNPADIKLTEHEEIAVVYGKAPKKIPSSWKFTPGE